MLTHRAVEASRFSTPSQRVAEKPRTEPAAIENDRRYQGHDRGASGDARAPQALDEGRADAIAFVRTDLANPDLPERIAWNAALTKDDRRTWYSQGPEG